MNAKKLAHWKYKKGTLIISSLFDPETKHMSIIAVDNISFDNTYKPIYIYMFLLLYPFIIKIKLT